MLSVRTRYAVPDLGPRMKKQLLRRLVSESHLAAKQIVMGNHLPVRSAAAIHERIYRLQLADPSGPRAPRMGGLVP